MAAPAIRRTGAITVTRARCPRRRGSSGEAGDDDHARARRTVPGVTIAGALAALLSALALYAGSGNCRWWLPAALCRHGKVTGLVLALVSLAAWIAALGVGAGLCAMLCCWIDRKSTRLNSSH